MNNLLGNAIDAMHPNGGNLLLPSREGTDRQTGQQGLVITVADADPGMRNRRSASRWSEIQKQSV